MEVIVKPTKDSLDNYINHHIHNFLLPLKDYAVEYTNYYDLDQIKRIKKQYPDIHIFVSINKNILNREINELKKILKELEDLNIKGIFYYDLALLSLKKKMDLKLDLVWNQTHMVTNYKTCDYYYDRGVEYALLSKEITKDEIIEIKNHSKITPIVELISYPVVAFSRRKLVHHYYQASGLEKKDTLEMIEPKTKQNYYLVENSDGVSFISKKVMNGSKILRELLNHNIDYILLKEDLINHDIFINCIDNINCYLKNYWDYTEEEHRKWIDRQNRLLGRNTNFFYRKTIYKVK